MRWLLLVVAVLCLLLAIGSAIGLVITSAGLAGSIVTGLSELEGELIEQDAILIVNRESERVAVLWFVPMTAFLSLGVWNAYLLLKIRQANKLGGDKIDPI